MHYKVVLFATISAAQFIFSLAAAVITIFFSKRNPSPPLPTTNNVKWIIISMFCQADALFVCGLNFTFLLYASPRTPWLGLIFRGNLHKLCVGMDGFRKSGFSSDEHFDDLHYFKIFRDSRRETDLRL